MTRNRRRKQHARALAAVRDLGYQQAAELVSAPSREEDVVLAERILHQLVDTLTAIGIPTRIERRLRGSLYLDLGCGMIHIARVAEPSGGLYADGDDLIGPPIHPDDPALFDLKGPIEVEAQFPFGSDATGPFSDLNVGFEFEQTFTGRESAADLAVFIADCLASGRRSDMKTIPRQASCTVCGDRYPFDELTDPADAGEQVCPYCIFDASVMLADPAKTVIAVSYMYDRRLSSAAGWSAVCALLCCLIGGDLMDLPINQMRDGTPVRPGSMCNYTGWLWLPPEGRTRPPALDGLACASALSTVVGRIDRAVPQLRDRVKTAVRKQAPHLHATPGLLDRVNPTVDRLWPAIIAYVITLETHRAEHPSDRGPWQVTESFDVVEWINELRSDLHYLVVQAVLRTGILIVQAELFPNE